MTGKTHQIIGISSGMAVMIYSAAPSYNPATFAAVLVCSSLAALLPDIDQPASDIWDNLPFGHKVSPIAAKFTFGHRNITHSLLGCAIFGGALYYLVSISPAYWGINKSLLLLAMGISYSLHLLADSFTVEGIPLLFPIHRKFGLPPKPFDGIRIMSGKWFENLVIFPIVNIFLISLVVSNWHQIKTILFK